MRTLKLLLAFFIVLGTTPMALAHDDRDDRNTVRARLSGYNEVHFVTTVAGGVVTAAALRGAVWTGATGTFRATIHDATQTIDYTVTLAAGAVDRYGLSLRLPDGALGRDYLDDVDRYGQTARPYSFTTSSSINGPRKATRSATPSSCARR